MKAIKIIAYTELGEKLILNTKIDACKWIVKHSLRKLKIKLTFTKKSLIIENPAFEFCNSLDHPKIEQGLCDIRRSAEKDGAKENKDYIVEMVK